jgi:hypothetical protein
MVSYFSIEHTLPKIQKFIKFRLEKPHTLEKLFPEF